MSDTRAASDSYFISYSRTDQKFALRFATDLRAREVAVWIDQLDIRPSEHWDRAIERAVRDCCGLVVILSPRSVESDNVMDEISYAIDRRKPVLPIMIERCTLPLRITRMQVIDATNDYDRALQQCLEAILFNDDRPRSSAAAPQGIHDPEIIRNAKEQLTGIVGPIAPILVDKIASHANSLGEFYGELAEHIPGERDRERFLGLSGTPAHSAVKAAAPAAAKAAESSLAREDVDRLAETLTSYLGPMAPVVTRRESGVAASAEELRERLALLIRNERERIDFLRRTEPKA
ncbi:MAG TPA: toll/interleukin-1 receptor domain-containing protein [Sphingomicrobium sp.]